MYISLYVWKRLWWHPSLQEAFEVDLFVFVFLTSRQLKLHGYPPNEQKINICLSDLTYQESLDKLLQLCHLRAPFSYSAPGRTFPSNPSFLLKTTGLILPCSSPWLIWVQSESVSHSVWLFATPWTVALQAPLSMNSPGKNTGLGYHFLLQESFPTQGLNVGLLNCRRILFWLSYQGIDLMWWRILPGSCLTTGLGPQYLQGLSYTLIE